MFARLTDSVVVNRKKVAILNGPIGSAVSAQLDIFLRGYLVVPAGIILRCDHETASAIVLLTVNGYLRTQTEPHFRAANA